MIGILTPLLLANMNQTPSHSLTSPGEAIQRMREWKSEQNRMPIDESINNALIDLEIEDGCDDSPAQKILLQFSGDEDQKSFRWGYHRCGD